MSHTELAGLHLNWIDTAPNQPDTATIVLLHPVGWDLTYWDRQIEPLRAHYRVVALDLPGHGRSTGTPEDCTFERMVATVVAFIEHVSPQPIHLVGSSFGSMLAQALVLARPHLVRSLTLMGTACTFAPQVRQGMRERATIARRQGMAALVDTSLARWFTPATRAQRPDLIDRITKTLLADTPLIHAAIWDAISHFDTQPRLGEIHCPTLLLVGEQDPSTPSEAAQLVQSGIAGSQLVVFPSASHMVQIEAPDSLNAALLSFLHAQAHPGLNL